MVMARERKKSAKWHAVDATLAEKTNAEREQEERRNTPDNKGRNVAKTFEVGARVSCAAREMGVELFGAKVQRLGAKIADASPGVRHCRRPLRDGPGQDRRALGL